MVITWMYIGESIVTASVTKEEMQEKDVKDVIQEGEKNEDLS